MRTKKIIAFLTAILVAFAMIPSMAFAESTPKSDDIVILATSDAHCAVNGGMGYAGLAGYRNAMQEQYNNVALVDAGDALQGDVIGSLSKGELIRDVLNVVNYDVLVPGNHEFDYGMDQFLNELAGKMNTEYVSCNFMKDGATVFKPYKIFTYGTKKVAFVGVTTPETFFKSTPTFFQDANGNYIYDFCQGADGQNLADAVQTAVNGARGEGADYVVVVGHLGDDESSVPYTSQELIAKTTGIDAFVDGHAHTTYAKTLNNKVGESVAMVSTGTKLANVGKIVIKTDGTITVENVAAANVTESDATVKAAVDAAVATNEEATKQVVGKTDVLLTGYDANGARLVRKQETNIGDFCADAYRTVLGGDIAFVNGGGIRKDIAVGDFTFGDVIAVHPYSNMACLIEATGQQIIDALELGSAAVGTGESGGFLQVSGLTYSVNPYQETTVAKNDKGEFVEVAGARKVSDVRVNGMPIELDKTYTVASHNYMLKQGGDGFTMFKGCKVIKDEIMVDNQVLITYVQDYLNGTVPADYAEPQGRIKILTIENVLADLEAAQNLLDRANELLFDADKEISDIKAELNATKAKLALAKYVCKVTAKKQKTNAKLTWNACKSTTVRYQVYKYNTKTKKYVKVATTSKNTFTTGKLLKGKTYKYKVRAIKTINGKVNYGTFSKVVYAKRA